MRYRFEDNMSNPTVIIPEGKIRLHVTVLHYVRLFIAAVARVLFGLYYGTEGEKLPPITEGILKESATEIARKIRTKEVLSVEVLETFIRRIKDVNSALNCFVEDRFEEALKEAKEADELVKSGSLTVEQLAKEKPFLGVPFTTKDCIAVKGLHHTAGVVLRKDVIAEKDSDVIGLLKAKGAIIIGLTNVPELCMWWETHNHIHGRTKNPYNTTRIVGGSSGGEGCIQAAAGSAFGIGSDIGGSVRMPCFFNGIFGHKPSRHIVSNIGQYPEAASDIHESFLVLSVEVLETFIRRIKDVNSALNCFVEDRFEEALKEAKEADELVKSGSLTVEQLAKEKPFLGVPFTTKDCIAVKGLHHTAGVVLRKDVIAEKDSDVIGLLKAKGAIIIGLTNVPELCMWWETHNHIHGRTKNPYNTTRIVGGSSGGEGCIQAAAGSAFGIGSDIGGSVRMPCFFNGIFGHKPSRHIVSNIGQYPEAASDIHESFLGIGPMVRHAKDLKPLLKIISGNNCAKLDLDEPVDVGKLKFFYQINNNAPLTDPVDEDIVAAMKKVIEMLQTKYQIKAEEKEITRLRKSNPIWLTLMKDEKKTFAERIMGKDGVGALCIEMLKNFIGCSGNTLIGIVTALVDRGGVNVGSERYNHYLAVRNNLENTFKEMLGDDGVFLYPTHPMPAPYHNEPLVRPINFCYTSIINCLGFPATHIPLGLSKDGLPIGIQVIANHNNDRLCLAVAEELDEDFGGWIEPQK